MTTFEGEPLSRAELESLGHAQQAVELLATPGNRIFYTHTGRMMYQMSADLFPEDVDPLVNVCVFRDGVKKFGAYGHLVGSMQGRRDTAHEISDDLIPGWSIALKSATTGSVMNFPYPPSAPSTHHANSVLERANQFVQEGHKFAYVSLFGTKIEVEILDYAQSGIPRLKVIETFMGTDKDPYVVKGLFKGSFKDRGETDMSNPGTIEGDGRLVIVREDKKDSTFSSPFQILWPKPAQKKARND